MVEPKFCKDCKFYKPQPLIAWNDWSECHHPKNKQQKLDLVKGSSSVKFGYAHAWYLRNSIHKYENICGEDAKWFEPK